MDEDHFVYLLAFALIIAGIVTMVTMPLKPIPKFDIGVGINVM